MTKLIPKLILARERYLEKRPVFSIAASLGRLSNRWLDKNFSFRKKAVRRLVEKSFFQERMAQELLNALFQELTQAKLLKLLKAELRDPAVLDAFKYDTLTGKWQRARGPRVITHIFSSNVPNPSIMSFIFGMLVKSVNIGKLSSKDEGFLDIYLDSLKDFDKKLAETNIILESTVRAHGRAPLHECIQKSNLVVAYGNNESLKEIINLVPVTTLFVGYGHRVSFGIYTKDALNKKNLEAFAQKTAQDIWMTDQRGCLSPMEIIIEEGGEISAEVFSAALKTAMERLFVMKGWRLPAGLRAVHAIGFAGRKMVSVRPVKNYKTILKILKPFQKYLQAVSLEVGAHGRAPVREMDTAPAQYAKIAEDLSRLGVNRICRAGQMQCPPITWHHDGKWNLASWLNWTDLEI